MHILAIDQGTTGTTTILYDRQGGVRAKAYRELKQHYPKPGWVEHDPGEIWQSVVSTIQEIGNAFPEKPVAIGITNQRETTIMWDSATGEPLHNAIVWQCRRTADLCNQLKAHEETFKSKTGLPVDAYFSATKIKWLLDNVPACQSPRALCGTVDSWLIWKLTGGAVHATDYTNASRTLLFDIHSRQWSEELCRLCGVPMRLLPEVRASGSRFGTVTSIPEVAGVPVCGVAGDQQAALFGQRRFKKGQIKNTYGTGCFILQNTGPEPVHSDKGLLTTLAVDAQGRPCYALEGAVFIAGAAIQWLRDELGLLQTAAESEKAATAVADNGGVFFVPAFTGLGAPFWDMQARGTLTGLTRGANRNHIIRAALEAMAFQTADVLEVMENETGLHAEAIAADGGACENNFLMQFQADILQKRLIRPQNIQSTSLGAAYLAGLTAGVWDSAEDLIELDAVDTVFTPAMTPGHRQELLHGWQRAVRQTRTV